MRCLGGDGMRLKRRDSEDGKKAVQVIDIFGNGINERLLKCRIDKGSIYV